VGKTLRFFADADIKNSSLVRLGTVSHTVNTDQRRVPLKHTCEDEEDGYRYCTAQIYPDPGVVLPGYYMLFVMNSAGVPSKAATIKVELDFPLSYFTEEEEEVEDKKDCDMDGKQVQGMVDMIFAAARKFWNPQQPTLVTQGQ
jgi:galactose oxidase